MSLETWMVGNGRLGELGDLEAGSVLGMEAVLRMAVGAGAGTDQPPIPGVEELAPIESPAVCGLLHH